MNQIAPGQQQQQQQYFQKDDQQQQPRTATAQSSRPAQSGNANGETAQVPQARAPVGDQDTMIIEEKVQMVNGESAIKRYERGPLLGKGGFAKCFSITNLETKKIMAAKIIPKNTLVKNRARQKLVSEIKIHKSLHQNNVVKFEHVFEDQENVYILLELCPHQTLNELIKRRKRISEVETMCYIVQIIQALKYLHANRVIHRDLKLGNLFIGDRMEIKLGDFGLATKLEFPGEKKRTICGTPNYIAPEILDGRIGHSYEVDIWSLGVILYTLLIGKPPFETSDVKKTYGRIKAGQYSFPEHSPIPNSAKALIQQILQQDPAKRPTLDEILAHSFFNNGGTIPKLLPVQFLNHPPPAAFIKQHEPSETNLKARPQQPFPVDGVSGGVTSPLGPKIGLDQPNNNNNSNNINKNNFAEDNNKRNLQPGSQFVSSPNLQQNIKGSFAANTPNEFPPAYNRNDNGTRSSTNQGLGNQQNPQQQQQPGMNNGRQQSMQQLQNNITSQSSRSLQQPQQPYYQQSTQQISNRGAVQSDTASTVDSSAVDGSKNDLWVAQYVDYTSKYGLGYLLSSGSSGVIFNDGTKIVLEPKGTYLEYIYKKDNEEITDKHNITEFPPEIQKKVTLLQHFRNYLVTESTKKMLSDTNTQNSATTASGSGNSGGNGAGNKAASTYKHNPNKPLPYLKKWMQTRQAIMFRLSNKIVQVLFSDKTEILLNSQDKVVSFMNKQGERSHYPLADAMASNNVDMTKRLRYTKDILVHLLRNNNTRNTNPNDPPAPEAPIDDNRAHDNRNNNGNQETPTSNQFGITSTMETDFPRLNSNLNNNDQQQSRGMQQMYSQKSLSEKDRQRVGGMSSQTSQQQLPNGNTAQYQQQQQYAQIKK